MRGTVPGLLSPHPLGAALPAIFHLPEPPPAPASGAPHEPFVQRFCAGLDEVLAPVFGVLEDLAAYVDPSLAPVDFLRWLASWLGADVLVDIDEERARAVVAEVVGLSASRGTIPALERILELVTGAKVEIWDSGGVVWADRPGAELPGTSVPLLHVRILDGDTDATLVRRVVDDWKPAHVPYELEVVST